MNKLLVGNKSDLEAKRAVTTEEAKVRRQEKTYRKKNTRQDDVVQLRGGREGLMLLLIRGMARRYEKNRPRLNGALKERSLESPGSPFRVSCGTVYPILMLHVVLRVARLSVFFLSFCFACILHPASIYT